MVKKKYGKADFDYDFVNDYFQIWSDFFFACTPNERF